MKKIPVGILGVTGMVGQRFAQLLENHPWFEVTALYASERSVGRTYEQAANWKLELPMPIALRKLIIQPCVANPTNQPKLMFSALDSSVATEIEQIFAAAGCAVISNAKNHRMDTDVPLLIPEVNPDHLTLIATQKKRRSTSGYIVTNPNCTTVGLALVLKPLHEAFGIRRVIVTSMQALSGAGYPGVSSLDTVDNVLPYIEGEEEKIETEPLKLLGSLQKGRVVPADIVIAASCNRVGVREGHLETVVIEFARQPSVDEVIRTLEDFKGIPQRLQLPSAPLYPIVYRKDADRPQPILDRYEQNGMAVVVGRVMKSSVLDLKLTLLVHNTIRGAAGAGVLNAELLRYEGLLPA